MYKLCLFTLLAIFGGLVKANVQFDAKGLVRLNYVDASGTDTWSKRGTGQTRFDENDDFELGQAILALNADFGDGWSAHTVLNHYQDPHSITGITQAFLKYQPLISPDYKLRVKAGLFYPEMSFENPDTGWTSPYTYSFSAINSWIAEELRVAGMEVKMDFTRKTTKSPHKFALIGSLYKGNDTVGSMLAWRGWGVHDRQSVLNETVLFAKYPSIGPGARVERQAAWVEPFRELDGRYGFYLGGEWNYQRKSRVRYYYYNNNGDKNSPWQEGGQRQWDTKFHSLAWQYRFNKQWRLLTQFMDGETEMGDRVVKLDFQAWYALVNYRINQHSVTARIDDFETVDTDNWLTDLNDGDGTGITLSYEYKYNKNWSFGAEFLRLDTTKVNRLQWPGRSADVDQKQLMLGVEYKF